MKHARILLLAICMTAGFASMSASAAEDGKVRRCQAKLHSCFRATDLSVVFEVAPTSTLDCISSCQAADGNPNACSKEECADRCAVAFGLVPPPCE